MRRMSFKLVLVFVCLNSVLLVRSDDTIVKTSSGTVKGVTVQVLNKSIEQYLENVRNIEIIKTSSCLVKGHIIQVLGKNIYEYLGIPYAEPPVGSLRFAKPKPISKPIEGVIDATKAKNSCIQPASLILGTSQPNEDCLVLNIWSPEPENNSTKLKPVMFWIFGGGLRIGSIYETNYNGSVLAAHDVVFVSVNYRLGHLGFLYGEDESAPGDVGFYDQLLALKWVRENIHLFGGDKNQITIFGQSSGSWSVSVHILSPFSRGLFKRAIMESGAHLYNKDRPILNKSETLTQAKELAKRINCTDDKQWLECLKKVDARLLLPGPNDIFSPLEGTEFLPISAQKAFSTQNFSKDIELIAGVVHDEGSLMSHVVFKEKLENFTKIKFDHLIEYTNGIYHNLDVEKVKKFYLANVETKNSTALTQAFYKYFGDIGNKCPTYHFAKQFAKHSPRSNTFFYELTYQGLEFSKKQGCDEKTMGICHGSDIEFVFGRPVLSPALTTKEELDFSLRVMKMWTNFAKTGYPDEIWPQLIQRNTNLIRNLNPHNKKDLDDPFKKECDEFWGNYFT